MNGATSLNQGYYDNTNPNPFTTNAGPGTLASFLLAGWYVSGSFYGGGSAGYYWSSTSRSAADAFTLDFTSGLVNSAGNNSRYYGFYVRCMLAD